MITFLRLAESSLRPTNLLGQEVLFGQRILNLFGRAHCQLAAMEINANETTSIVKEEIVFTNVGFPANRNVKCWIYKRNPCAFYEM
jgi:hypothetical protein